MIRTLLDSADDSYDPNAGKQIHLVNNPGQANFALTAHVFAFSTDGAYTGVWSVWQYLIGTDDEILTSLEKADIAVSIAVGETKDLGPLTIGQLPMTTVDTNGTTFRYRRKIIDQGDGTVIEDNVTPLAFDVTDTRFAGQTVPYVEPPKEGANDATAAIVAEIKVNDNLVISLSKEIPEKQARLAALAARNKALKAVPGIPNEVPAPPSTAPVRR